MNLDELQSVQARERQSSDLQHLRSSFYREVGEYIAELTDRRSELVAEVDEPFSSAEVRQLTDDIETAEQTVEAIYERRVGKVVKKASIAAAGMPVDDDGLTAEEEALFEALVDRIERNRETVLSVLDGEPPTVPDEVGGSEADAAGGPDGEADTGRDVGATAGDSAPPADTGVEGAEAPDPEDGGDDPDGVDAADLMGGDGADGSATGPEHGSGTGPGTAGGGTDPTEVPPDAAPPGEPGADRAEDATDDATRSGSGGEPGGGRAGSESPAEKRPSSSAHDGAPGSADATPGGQDREPGRGDVPGIPRTTVRITADVGEVVGADNRDYDLGPEDVVTLPEANADVLVEKDAAERLE